MCSNMPKAELTTTRTVSARTVRTTRGPVARTSSAIANARTSSVAHGISWTTPFQWRSVASSTAVPTVLIAASTTMPSRRCAAVRRVPDRGVRSWLRLEDRDNLVNHSRCRVVLGELLAQLGEVRVVRRVRAVLHDLVGPLLRVGDPGRLEGRHELVLR